MLQIPVEQASTTLDELLDKVVQGQDVVIIGADGGAFKLLPLPRVPLPQFGSAKGLVEIKSDFDDPVEGMEAYLP